MGRKTEGPIFSNMVKAINDQLVGYTCYTYKTLKMKTVHLFLVIFTCCCGCNPSGHNDGKSGSTYYSDQFSDYWYSGKAEITSYHLKQARYGEIHNGHAVLIFVTEPFSKERQVKLDNAEQAGEDRQTVLKMNFTKKFETGIYPYSMMLSAFTPVNKKKYPHTVKVTMSSQEWCGHIWSQMNLNGKKYDIRSYSYFEKEGDQSFSLERTMLEDEVWSMARLNFNDLPTGEIAIIPGLFATRLLHKELKPVQANASLTRSGDIGTYTIKYKERTLSIEFGLEFPHQIKGWKETQKGIGGKELTTTATLNQSITIDYWNRNSKADSYLRDSLGLP